MCTDLVFVLRTMHEAQAQRVVHLAATLSISSEAEPAAYLEGCHKQMIKNIQIWIAPAYFIYFQ